MSSDESWWETGQCGCGAGIQTLPQRVEENQSNHTWSQERETQQPTNKPAQNITKRLMWLPCLKSEVNANTIKTILLVKSTRGNNCGCKNISRPFTHHLSDFHWGYRPGASSESYYIKCLVHVESFGHFKSHIIFNQRNLKIILCWDLACWLITSDMLLATSIWIHSQIHPSLVTASIKAPRWWWGKRSSQGFLTLHKSVGDIMVATSIFYTVYRANSSFTTWDFTCNIFEELPLQYLLNVMGWKNLSTSESGHLNCVVK